MVSMFVRATIRLLMAAAAFFAASVAGAQIYKWVDENGVTNYSSQRPAGPKAPGKVGIVEDNISIYTPDPGLVEAVDAFRVRSNEIGRDARAAEVSPANQYTTPVYVPVPLSPDPCAGYRTAHCDELYTGYYPHAPVAGHRGYRRRHQWIPQKQLRPGAIAGQVVGMDGYIPGNSANARRFGPAPARSVSQRAFEPSSAGGRPVQLPSRFR